MKKNSVRRFYPVRERSKASTKVENKPLKRRKSVGQGLVEFALVAPLLLLTIFGIIDIARIIQAQLTVDNAARQAIRFAITGQTLKDAGGNYIPRATIYYRPGNGRSGGLAIDQHRRPASMGLQ